MCGEGTATSHKRRYGSTILSITHGQRHPPLGRVIAQRPPHANRVYRQQQRIKDITVHGMYIVVTCLPFDVRRSCCFCGDGFSSVASLSTVAYEHLGAYTANGATLFVAARFFGCSKMRRAGLSTFK